ncbi:citrate synthase-lysine N-methyltransferase CSKMT, mitochondrial [Aplysia californica]|uniref:Citrate synthase-lysine N-methyltransferase CSKMT, mitochondrial n=1 Tax=Aplysia californica TaxID=6500 RepID=A0ABM0JNL9_APLCA|nr:citrate synthase-lysine N-methyltransferase CSKMT, mitochondrial [Aplysia californica]
MMWSRLTFTRKKLYATGRHFLSSEEKLSKLSFWKSQYQKQSPDPGFDWFVGPENVTNILQHHMQELWSVLCGSNSKPSSEIKSQFMYLELGCGTSLVPHDVIKTADVPVSAVLLDYVHEALAFQRQNFDVNKRGGNRHALTVCADVMSLPLKSCSFHLAVDKGTMDALLRNRQHGKSNSQAMLSEALRVLQRGGRYLQISDEDPDVRIDYLDSLWKSVWPKVCYSNSSNADSASRNLKNSVDSTGEKNTQANSYLCESNLVRNSSSGVKNCVSSGNLSSAENSELCDKTSLVDSSCPLGSWSFKVVPSQWGQEYFVYWRDK